MDNFRHSVHDPPVRPRNKPHTMNPPNWKLVLESVHAIGGQGTLEDIRNRFKSGYPDRKVINVRHELVMLSVNHPKRIHYSGANTPRRSDSEHDKDQLFHDIEGIYQLYDPARHGVWEIYLDADSNHDVRRID